MKLQTGAARLAAKFGDGGGEGPQFHPLVCHMLDVAAVTMAIWDDALSENGRAMLATGLSLPEHHARTWVAFLAGLHDLGKASKPFQAKDIQWPWRLAGTGLSANGSPPDLGHGMVTSVVLPDLLSKQFGIEPRLARKLAGVVGGHHGRFLDIAPEQVRGSLGEDYADGEAWRWARAELVAAVAGVVGIEGRPIGEIPNRVALLLAGLTTVVDWIGSMSERFEFCPHGSGDLNAYFTQARDRAVATLRELGWRTPAARLRSFEQLFPGIKEPRELQRRMADAVNGGGIIVVEAPMGEGKTEAALFAADVWSNAGSRGCYVALPTQATANQMFDRVRTFVRQAYGDEAARVLLAHGETGLFEAELPVGVAEDGGDVVAGEWFVRNRKRRLLATHAVGTVDQALMAALRVKHVFVRLFALAGKAVVIDEVHAYDVYMTTLLERLLEWLGALRSPVVLLSATLPARRRDALMRAYLRGREGWDAAIVSELGAPYPRLTWSDGASIRSVHAAASTRSHRMLRIEPVSLDDDAVVAFLQNWFAGQDGCCAVVCNTVARAQALFQLVRESLAMTDVEVSVFHARFVREDRSRVEAACLTKFGPAPAKRPRRSVLIATQVIEQSLDLDFDVMISDFAPLDLLLQRSGRLQRHERGPREMPPTLFIRGLSPNAAEPIFEAGTKVIYDEHILLRTWWALRERQVIELPDDIEGLIEFVYADGEDAEIPPDGMDATLASHWLETRHRMQAAREQEQREAEARVVRPPTESVPLAEYTRDVREEDAPELHPQLQATTRLSEPSIDLVLLNAGSELLPRAKTAPSTGAAVRLRLRTVSVSNRRAYLALAAVPVPPSFAKSPWLRHHRLVVLENGRCVTASGVELRYDSELGLQIGPEASG